MTNRTDSDDLKITALAEECIALWWYESHPLDRADLTPSTDGGDWEAYRDLLGELGLDEDDDAGLFEAAQAAWLEAKRGGAGQ